MSGIRVEYTRDIAGFDGHPARFKGETYAVADEATAKKLHPMATIVSNADGSAFEPSAAPDATLPVWYRKKVEKAQKAGDEIPAMRDGETQSAYEARVAEEAAAREAGENAQHTGEPSGGDTGGESGNGSGQSSGEQTGESS